jgi:hypothetical protein
MQHFPTDYRQPAWLKDTHAPKDSFAGNGGRGDGNYEEDKENEVNGTSVGALRRMFLKR